MNKKTGLFKHDTFHTDLNNCYIYDIIIFPYLTTFDFILMNFNGLQGFTVQRPCVHTDTC